MVANGPGKEQEYPKVPQSMWQRWQELSGEGTSLLWSQDNCREEEGKRQLNFVSPFPAFFNIFFVSGKLSPLLQQALENEHSLWASSGTGIGSWRLQRLWLGWRSLCVQRFCDQMAAYTFLSPCNGKLSKTEGKSCASCVDNMDRATFSLWEGVQDRQLK